MNVDDLVREVRELILQIDDGPRDCCGTRQDGTVVWKGSFLTRVERLRALLQEQHDRELKEAIRHGPGSS